MKRFLCLCVLPAVIFLLTIVAPVNAAAATTAATSHISSASVTSTVHAVVQTPCVAPSHVIYDPLRASDTIQPGDSLGVLMLRNAIPFSALNEVLKANPKIGDPNLVYAGEVIHFGNASMPRYAVLQPGETAAYATAYWFGGSATMGMIGGKNDYVTFASLTNATNSEVVVPMFPGPDSGQWYRFRLQAESGSCTPAEGHNASLYKGIERTSCIYPHPADYLVFNDPIWFGDCFGFQAGISGHA